jgi:hypothetical protein
MLAGQHANCLNIGESHWAHLEIDPFMLERVPDAPREWAGASAFVSDPFEEDQRHGKAPAIAAATDVSECTFGGALRVGRACLLSALFGHGNVQPESAFERKAEIGRRGRRVSF